MTTGNCLETAVKPLSIQEFDRLSELISRTCGIKMSRSKKIMLEARLQKRLSTLGIESFKEYCERIFESPEAGREIMHMIDAVTTNKTDFFREPVHFAHLAETVLPEFMENEGRSGKAFIVWSAGCSTGEEPYTLAMVLSEFAGTRPGFRFSILGTDISTKALESAALGIYEEERADAIPARLKHKYLMRSRDRRKGLVRIVPSLRACVTFRRLNLMDGHMMLPEPVDAIFCRNVIIYFERRDQERLLTGLCRSLKTGGRLFLGHSETVHGFDLPLGRVTSTVYRKAE